MRLRHAAAALACASVAALSAHHPEDKQHGGPGGHLPPSSANVELTGRLRLTNVAGGIADVAAFGSHAYLAAFHPECGGNPDAQGTGVHVVDIVDPANPVKVGFLAAEPNSYVGEGVHVFAFRDRHLLVHNNETCDTAVQATSGVALWDVTNPLAPTKLGQFGDASPAVLNHTYHSTHSVQGFVWENRAYAVAQDNLEWADVDIFDVTGLVDGTGAATLVWEGGLDDWPGAWGTSGLGDNRFHHDMQQKVIDGRNLLLLSYWDAGQILLDISNPASPVYLRSSVFPSPDTLTGFALAEGNSHQSYWSSDNRFILATEEDFAAARGQCAIEDGPNAGDTPCREFAWTVPLAGQYPAGFAGTTVFGGYGCVSDANGNGISDRAEVPARAASGADAIVFVRGVCPFSEKVVTAEMKGYGMVVIGQSHEFARNGLTPDSLTCGPRAQPVLGEASAVCIGHRAMHLLFDQPPAYSGADLPAIGTPGHRLSARGNVFDGWGYVRLLDAATLRQIGAYAVPESLDPAFASGFGQLSVHEVKTDPRANVHLAYLSYYDAGLRVVKFGRKGIHEVGHYIDERGNQFWGVVPHMPVRHPGVPENRGAPDILLSDRSYGLWILRYTGE